MTSVEVENLKAQIGELSQRIAAVELARDTGSDTDSSGAVDPGGANEAQVIEAQKLHAFDITCDGREADPWLVYLPDGCVRFGDFTPDRIDPEPDANTHLADLGTDIKDGGIYAHLYLELADDESGSDSTSEPEVTGFPLFSIDTEPEQQPAEERMKVINIQIATIKDGAVSQTVIGALILNAKSGSGTVVESLNGETGDITIEGGHKVQVTKDGKTITVSLDESKEDPERDPNTNCDDHPGSSEGGGGVIIGPSGGGGSGGAGVPAEGSGSSGVGCDC